MDPSKPYLPFQERFHEDIRDGIKTRSKRYGAVGDIVQSPVGPLAVLAQERVSLGFVAAYLWKYEGLDSEEAFIDVWKELHPGTGFRGEERKWLHVFRWAPRLVLDPDYHGTDAPESCRCGGHLRGGYRGPDGRHRCGSCVDRAGLARAHYEITTPTGRLVA